MTENISRQRTETSDFARASCRIFCGMLRRIGYSVAGTHERVLTAVFEALREASLEGSVCVGRSRFESVYRRLFAEPATLTEALGVLRLFDCVRVHGDAPNGDQRAALPFVADVATVEGGSQEAVRLYSERSFVAELRLAQKIWALADIDGKNAVQAADETEAGPGPMPSSAAPSATASAW